MSKLNKIRGRQDHNTDMRQEVREQRNRLHGPRDILNVNTEFPGKHLCWVVDDDSGQVARYQQVGYEFVLSNTTAGETTVDRPVGSPDSIVWKNVGAGRTAYLMAIDQDRYDEHLQAIEDEIQSLENEMFRTGNDRHFDGSYGNPKLDNRNIKR